MTLFAGVFYFTNISSSLNNLIHLAGIATLLLAVFKIYEKNQILKEKIELTKELKLVNDKLQVLATRDFLTNIGNRRYFFDLGEKSLYQSLRDGKLISLIVMDIDDFKQINDNYGHQVGDDVLIDISKVLTFELRKSDILARVGGEEFAILLPATNLDKAIQIGEKLRMGINKLLYKEKGSSFKVSGSFGVTQVNLNEDKNLDDLYARSDNALYKAKSGGKNRVCYS